MQGKHWGLIVVVLVVGYLIGTHYPNILSSIKSKVTG